MARIPLAKFSSTVLLFMMVNLKAATSEPSPVITFPPTSAHKWILPNGLTIIVQEDRSAPVASVQAWCATGSIDEDQHLGAGLSHILEHMLFKGTKTRGKNEIAQKIQDVGGYINAYTSFDRTVFWIDVPKDGIVTALDILADAMMNSTLPPEEYQKEQEVIRREFAMGMDDPDRMAGLLLFSTAYQIHPYRFPVIGEIEIYNQLTQEQVMQYYKTRYVPNNLTFVVVGDVDAEKVRQQLTELFKPYLEKSLKPVFIPAEPPQLGRREVHQEFATELTQARKITLSHHLGALTTMRGQASDIGSNWLLTRDLNFSRHYLDAVQKVTLDDIKRVAASYLTENNLTVISLNPKGSLAAKTEGVKAGALGEIQKFELSNGLRLLVREDPRLPLVAMGAVFRGGLLAETPQTNGITRLMAKVLLKGTKTRTAEQIANEIEAVGGSISSDAGNNSFSVSIDVMKPDVKLGVGLLSDALLNATMPEKAIAREKEIQIAAIQQEEEQLTAVARNIMRQALFPQHPYALRSNGSVESVQRLTQKDLLEFRDRYVVAKNGVIYVFGDVKASEVKQLFEQALGKMKPGALALTDARPSAPLGKPEMVESRKDKAQGVIMVGFRGASLSSPDRYALELIDEASSDLGSRFFIRIREQMGLAYYVGASQMQGLVPGLFAFYLGTDPQKIEPVKTALLDEIYKLANEGLTPQELARAKKKLIGQQEIANQSNDAFGYHCSLDELYGLGLDYYNRLEHDVDAVTLDDIKQVAAKYFRDQPYVLATVRPPEGSAATKQK